jgi:hypothetical protein
MVGASALASGDGAFCRFAPAGPVVLSARSPAGHGDVSALAAAIQPATSFPAHRRQSLTCPANAAGRHGDRILARTAGLFTQSS